MSKSRTGNYFEDFRLGQVYHHPVPRTVTEGDAALYLSLTGQRFPLSSSTEAARRLGLARAPIDELLAFHIVFGKTVTDISLNAVANLGYAGLRVLHPLWPGDTVTARSTVIGVKQTSSGAEGIVYVHTEGFNQQGTQIIEFYRWVLLRKRDRESPPVEAVVPDLPAEVDACDLVVPAGLDGGNYDTAWTGSSALFEDYVIGEKIDHLDGLTVEEAEHQMATRLYQNDARVHFNLYRERAGRFGCRLIYGGHVISLMRALSFNGLANALAVVAINGGRHVQPLFAGGTIFAWSEVKGKSDLPGRSDLGAVRVRSFATKDLTCEGYPGHEAAAAPNGLILDLDYWVIMPRRPRGIQ